MLKSEVGDYVSRCASLAALLEVSAYPKPGNVHRTRDFPDTMYEHFLAAGVAIGPEMRRLAVRGFEAVEGSREWAHIGVGGQVLKAVTESLSWQTGGNVNLGVVLLFSPLAVAAGASLFGDERVDVKTLREMLRKATRTTTPDDAVAVYEAIGKAMTPRVLGEAEELDVTDETSLTRIRNNGLTLIDVFELCSERDSICHEWVSDFEVTFEVGSRYLNEALDRSGDVNASIVDTFLQILSKRPDSLIRRKRGVEKAVEVSERAAGVLEEGGMESEKGGELLRRLDEELQSSEGALNPGTTADLTAASLFVTLLEGWRP
ncbi:MAG: triphosphoribosyl-dephospho-CoA synthase [Candidatus Bathyarchaeota archaeon]|nr:MAG: triphosphoribosyl-dephospho-CoA synthase [Candidatus Bathyarchaeota archaeon]